ncbi:MAG: circularly permuted type 2 ATP-grasp protein [Rhodospirillales bacterium]|nr:circularly permuted type 2 ATP-grasp protein [Rhodospirillales bacterium]
MGAVREIGNAELARRAAALNRQMGLAAPLGAPAARIYDPLPALLTAADFSMLEDGIKQRASLLSLVLEDIYGWQNLMRSGQLPPALVFAAPHFLRPLHTGGPLATPRLGLYAADVIRAPDGRFVLLNDHTGVVPGLGDALSLRRLATGTLPELFRASALRSIRPAREMLVDHLQREAEGGLVAVLSGGLAQSRENEDGFDDALLARALGVMLIEPGDLAARNGALHMKTLSGLLHVAKLVRGVSGLDLDPLEQGGRPGAGIPGAFGAIRAGVLSILNAPGSKLLESAALRPYIQQLFTPLLGEPEKLPLADAGGEHLASLAPFLGPEQETIKAPLCLRLFAWHDGAEWQVLPGGLGLPMPAGGAPTRLGIKDLWVLDSEEPSMIAGAPPAEPPEHVKFLGAAHLPSRLADNLFWLGRSVERLEAAARLLILALPRLESGTSLPRDMAERTLISRCLGQAGLLPPDVAGFAISGRLLRQTLAQRRPVDKLLQEVARLVDASSERLSPSMLATVRFALQQAREALPNEDAALPAMLSFAATFAGIAAENMSRDGGWLFLEMGRRLERGETLAETLAILLNGPVGRLEPGMALGIEIADSVLSYELRHAGILAPGPVLAMLLAELSNPRALAFQCNALRACLERLGADDDSETAKQLQQEITNLAGDTVALNTTLSGAAAKLRQLSDRVQRRFFTLLPEAHTLEEGEILEAAQ